MFLQSHVVPVCVHEKKGTTSVVKELHGSAFFINNDGTFLTARHVLEGVIAKAKQTGLQWGLCQKYEHGKSPVSVMCPVAAYEFAPEPYDVAVGRSTYQTETILTLSPFTVSEWQDVVAFGYPLNIIDWESTRVDKLGLRCHKGYVQRLITPGEMKIAPDAPGFELSFTISRGLSGGPVFVSRHPRDVVIGVCVGSVRSELIDYEHIEVEDDGTQLKESRLKIEEFGLAHDLMSLHQWKPDILEGKSLLEAAHMEGK